MSTIPLNKFEKEQRVIELHSSEGKTIREIAKDVHMSFRDISKITKAYDKKVRLQQSKKEENNQPKKLSTSTQALKLFSDGKQPTEVAIILDINYERVSRLWSQFLKLEKKYECYEFYQECQNDLPILLSINNFMKRNNVYGNNIVNVLRTATNVNNLNQTYSNLKMEIKYLEQRRMYLQYNPHSKYRLQPLTLNRSNYNY